MCNQNILLSDAKEAANSAEMSPPSYSILVDYKNERKEKEKATYDRCQTQSISKYRSAIAVILRLSISDQNCIP